MIAARCASLGGATATTVMRSMSEDRSVSISLAVKNQMILSALSGMSR